MKKLTIFAFAFAFATFGFIAGASFSPSAVHAQNPNLTPYQFTVSSPHTTCNVSLAGQANYCYGSDGPYVSINGAAYVAMLAGAPAAITATAPLVMSGSTLSCPSCGPVYTAAAPVTITGSVISLPNAALKTQIDTLGLVAAQSAVQ